MQRMIEDGDQTTVGPIADNVRRCDPLLPCLGETLRASLGRDIVELT